MNLQKCVPSWLFAVIFFFISIISCKYMMFVHKKVNNVQEELLSYFFASERVFLYCFSLFSIAGDMPKVWIINRDLKKLFNASSGVEKEEKNQQTWLAWYIKRQNNRGIHWFFIKRPNSWQTPIIHLCITFVHGPLSVFTLATADPLRLHVFHYYVGYFNFFPFAFYQTRGCTSQREQ